MCSERDIASAMENRYAFGRNGEGRAAEFLESKGFAILNRNYRCGRIGEMDIIARRESLLLFVEVKSRNSKRYGGALYAVTQRKRKTLRYIAAQYLACHPELNSRDITCRFDVIAYENGEIQWIEDAIR